MPNRDYAARSKKSGKGVNKLLILLIIFLLLGMSALALMLLKSKEPVQQTTAQPAAVVHQKSELPTPPAEIYSYIRDLETREVPVDKNARTVQLSKEQEQQLQRQKEEAQRKQEQAEQLLAQQQAAKQQAEQANVEPITVAEQPKEVAQEQPKEQVKETPKIKALTPEELEAKRAAERKAAEEKRKQAEAQKQKQQQQAQQQQAQTAEQAKKAAEKPAEKAKDAKPTKVVAKPATEAPKVVGKFGLQCGAFKNKAQAENMQARLAMAGYNARIASSGDWNRVFVGPIGDRAAASKAQSNARSVAECMIVGM